MNRKLIICIVALILYILYWYMKPSPPSPPSPSLPKRSLSNSSLELITSSNKKRNKDSRDSGYNKGWTDVPKTRIQFPIPHITNESSIYKKSTIIEQMKQINQIQLDSLPVLPQPFIPNQVTNQKIKPQHHIQSQQFDADVCVLNKETGEYECTSMEHITNDINDKNGVITLSLNELARIDPRWNMVISLFRTLCTNPSDEVCVPLTEEQKCEWKESQEYPVSFEEIDRIEQEDKHKERETHPITRPPDRNGWVCFSKCINVNSMIVMDDFIYKSLKVKLEEIFESTVKFRGLFFYPPGGYHKWHSNQYDPHGWRIYLVGLPNGGDSSFYYIDKTTKLLRERNDQDLVINMFKVGADSVSESGGSIYHSVASRTANRFSFGILVDDQQVEHFLTKNLEK